METKNKKYTVKATCEVVFYIPIEAKSKREADKIASAICLSGDFDTSCYDFDGELIIQDVTEAS